jgi:predicted 3-demethylubiquinone-9 3-methyltransferase (glyoxalase superfamily)
MPKIQPCLWFDREAEEAANHYVSIFKKDSKILHVSRYGKGGPMPEGAVMVVIFQLDGQQFMALNGGPKFTFSEAISLNVTCEGQGEVDDKWEKLSAGGSKGQCGWLKDKYGLSWQIVPAALPQLMSDPDPKKQARVMHAMMQMTKIDIAALQRAADQS